MCMCTLISLPSYSLSPKDIPHFNQTNGAQQQHSENARNICLNGRKSRKLVVWSVCSPGSLDGVTSLARAYPPSKQKVDAPWNYSGGGAG